MISKFRLIAIFTILTLLSVALGCRKPSIEELSRVELFSLGIGKMDNQIDLFQIDGQLYNRKNRIYLRDGLFYVANGNSAKIMEFSSYGDLIFLLYNPDKNPKPVSFNYTESEDLAVTRKALSYPLRNIGELVVDRDKRIYLEDFLPEDRWVKDKKLAVVLNREILRFDRHGNKLDSIGQEGVGGSPFPYIESIEISGEDEPVVICRTPEKWLIFWYTRAGSLLYQVEIDQDHLPRAEEGEEVIPSVAGIFPDPTRHFLYLMLYYYHDTIDESTKITTAVESFSTRIFGLNLETGRYEELIEVPQNGVRKERVGTQEIEVPVPSFELLGISSSGHFFLLRREGANLFQLLILSNKGKITARRYLIMEDSELYYKDIRLSASGIVYGLLAEEYRARIVWWRSDRLLGLGGESP